MAWSGNSDTIGKNTFKNYMYGSNVYLLDVITSDNCAFLLGDLTNYIQTNVESTDKTISFLINSPGGETNIALNIIGAMNLARLNGFEIETINLGRVSSAASLIAAQGDTRFMSRYATNMIHFGCYPQYIQGINEIDKANINVKNWSNTIKELYLNAAKGKLSEKKLDEFRSDEQSVLTAEECLKYGLVDIIIEDELAEKVKLEKYSKEYAKGFDKYKNEQEINNKTKVKLKKIFKLKDK